MRKSLGRYFCHYFKMPHLFREDLKAIEAIIQKELKPKAFHIAFDGVEYDSVEDIDLATESTHVLVIYTQEPAVRLKFARSWAELYCGIATPKILESGEKIAKIVHKRERENLWIFGKYSSWMAPLLGFGSIAVTMGMIHIGSWPADSLYAASTLLVFCAVWWAIGYRCSLYAFSRVDLV